MDRRSFIAAASLAGLGMALGGRSAPAAAHALDLRLRLADFTPVLTELDHPEGIASAPDGRLFFSSMRFALGVRERNGCVREIGTPLAPAGVAVDPAGRVLVANVGLLNGGPGPLQRIDVRKGTVETLANALEGRALVASNCPVAARDGTVYCSHSSWGPVTNIGRTDPSGFIYRVGSNDRADIVARGLRGVNGLCLDARDRHLYAALTGEGRIVRFRRKDDGSLGLREDYGPVLGRVIDDHEIGAIRALPPVDQAELGYCDGIGFDMVGNLWVTLPFGNRLVAITPDGDLVSIVDDPVGATLSMPTNLCWGGADRRDLYVVSRAAGTILHARTAEAGLPTANWPASLTPP